MPNANGMWVFSFLDNWEKKCWDFQLEFQHLQRAERTTLPFVHHSWPQQNIAEGSMGNWFSTTVFLFRGRLPSNTDCKGELPGLSFCISIKEFRGPLRSIWRWEKMDQRIGEVTRLIKDLVQLKLQKSFIFCSQKSCQKGQWLEKRACLTGRALVQSPDLAG